MIYTIENKNLKVSVETLGAQLKSMYSKDSQIEYLWQGDKTYWAGRAYNLFPYVGRLAQGKYVTYGKEYAMDRHGFARGSEFTLTDKTENSMTFSISATEKTLEIYPFEFIFSVTFSIKEKTLTVSYDIKNVGNQTMYFGLGGHPGFNVPFDGGKFEDYFVEFEKECFPTRVIANEKGLITPEREIMSLDANKKINLEHYLFDNDAIIMKPECKTVYVKGSVTDKAIKVTFSKMDNLGIWQMPKTDAPFICIEPWMTLPANDGKPEVLETKENIGKIESGKNFTTEFEIEIIE